MHLVWQCYLSQTNMSSSFKNQIRLLETSSARYSDKKYLTATLRITVQITLYRHTQLPSPLQGKSYTVLHLMQYRKQLNAQAELTVKQICISTDICHTVYCMWASLMILWIIVFVIMHIAQYKQFVSRGYWAAIYFGHCHQTVCFVVLSSWNTTGNATLLVQYIHLAFFRDRWWGMECELNRWWIFMKD